MNETGFNPYDGLKEDNKPEKRRIFGILPPRKKVALPAWERLGHEKLIDTTDLDETPSPAPIQPEEFSFDETPAENPSDNFTFDDQPDTVISEPPVAEDATKPVEIVAESTYNPADFPDFDLDPVTTPEAPALRADSSSAVEATSLAEPASIEEPSTLDNMAQSPAADALTAAADGVLPFEMSPQERRKTEHEARKAQAAEVKGVIVGEKLGGALPIVAKVYGQSPEQAQKEKEQRISAWEQRLHNNPILNKLVRLWARYKDYSDKNQEKFGNKPKAPKA